MKKNNKILFIHHGKGIGGASNSGSMIAKRLKKDGYNVKIIFLFKSNAIDLFKDINYSVINLPIKYFNHSSKWNKIYKIHYAIYEFLSWLITIFLIAPFYIIKEKPKLIYLNSSVLSDWLFISKILNIKSIVHVRETIANGYFGLRKSFLKYIINNCADKIIFIGDHNYERLTTNPIKSIIVPNYVKIKTRLSEKKIYDFIYVGGNHSIKGVNLIFDLIKHKPDINICLLGKYYSKDFKFFNKFKNVFCPGMVINPLDYISKSKFLIFPATTPHFPRPIIEAFATGTVPISAKLDGYEKFIIENKNGYFFTKNSVESLIKKIEHLKKINLNEIRDNGYQTYITNYSIKNEDKIIECLEIL